MKKKKDKKKNVKYRRSWWKKCKERIASFLTAKRKEEEVGKKGRKSDKRPERDKSWGSLVDCSLSPGAFGTELALCQCCSTRNAEKD